MRFRGYKVIFLYVILLCVLVACTGSDSQSKIETKDKAPDSLVGLATGIDDILSLVGNIERLTLEIPIINKDDESKNKPLDEEINNSESPSSGAEQSGSGAKPEQSGGENTSSDPKATPPSQQEKNQKKEEETNKIWDDIATKLDDIHPKWNSFEADGAKKGATNEMGEKFESNFNKMTKAIESKNILETYNYGAESFSSLKPLFDLYTDEIGGDMSYIKYSAYKAYTKALEGNTTEASKLLTGREENINKIRLKMTEEKEKEEVEKISIALADFKNSLVEKSRMLNMIKKDIIIQNIKALE